jgi:hypothetical protein
MGYLTSLENSCPTIGSHLIFGMCSQNSPLLGPYLIFELSTFKFLWFQGFWKALGFRVCKRIMNL